MALTDGRRGKGLVLNETVANEWRMASEELKQIPDLQGVRTNKTRDDSCCEAKLTIYRLASSDLATLSYVGHVSSNIA